MDDPCLFYKGFMVGHFIRHGVERAVTAAASACDVARVHALFRPHDTALHHLPLLRQPSVLLLQRVHQPGHDRPDRQRRYFHQGQRPEVSLPLFQERPAPHQLRPHAVRRWVFLLR